MAQLPQKFQQALDLHQAGQLASAQAIYDEILRLQPGHADAINLLGTIAIQVGDLQKAAQLFERAIDLDADNLAAHCNSGWALWKLGQLEAALARYDQALALREDVAEAHFNRGNVLRDLRQWETALASYRQATTLDSDYAEAHAACGHVLGLLKRYDAALASYDQAIAILPDYEEAYSGRIHVLTRLKLQHALELHQGGQSTQARTICEEILSSQPRHADAINVLGNIALQTRHSETAVELFERAIAINPSSPVAYCSSGIALAQLCKWDAALARYDQAIALAGDIAEVHLRRGNMLYELKRWEEALASFNRAIALKDEYADAHANRGLVLRELKQWDAALASCQRAIALRADCAENHVNRGLVLVDLKRSDEALASFDRAIALKDEYADAHYYRANVLYERLQLHAALAGYDRAVALKNDYAEAHFHRALAYLLLGDFDNGWVGNEWRWKRHKIVRMDSVSQPLWLGEVPLVGKTILLRGEQGLGDTLQFCRYAKLVSDLGARVILEVQEPLRNLLVGMEGVSRIIARGEAPPEFDYQCPLLSLPLAFKTKLASIPSSIRYLTVDAAKIEQWQARLGPKTQTRIGLAWSGSVTHKNDHQRSIALADLMPHLPAGFQYVSLQKEVREADGRTLQSNPGILRFPEEWMGFLDTAALCECLDVVISVDTSLAHLSAALGRNTWILLSFVPDWRWLLDRQDSPWYPTAKLYRQHDSSDWKGVFKQVGADLRLLQRSSCGLPIQ